MGVKYTGRVTNKNINVGKPQETVHLTIDDISVIAPYGDSGKNYQNNIYIESDSNVLIKSSNSASNTTELRFKEKTGGSWVENWSTGSIGVSAFTGTILKPGRLIARTYIYANWNTPVYGFTYNSTSYTQHSGPNIGYTNYPGGGGIRLNDTTVYHHTNSPSNSGSDIEMLLVYDGTGSVSQYSTTGDGRWYEKCYITHTEGNTSGQFITLGHTFSGNTPNGQSLMRLYSYSGTTLTREDEIVLWNHGSGTQVEKLVGFKLDDGRFIVHDSLANEWKYISATATSLTVDSTFTATIPDNRWNHINTNWFHGEYNTNGEILGGNSWIIPYSGYAIDGTTNASGWLKLSFNTSTNAFNITVLQEYSYDSTTGDIVTAAGYFNDRSTANIFNRNNGSQTRLENSQA